MGQLAKSGMFILAAGFGTRLRPLTDGIPKPLIPFGSATLLELIVSHYKREGIGRFVINTHHLADKVSDYIADKLNVMAEFAILKEEEILGTGGGIRNASGFFKGQSFLAANVDAFATPDVKSLLNSHSHSEAIATMVLRESPIADSYGAIFADESGRVVSILGERSPLPSIGESKKYMYAGIQVVSPKLISYLPKSEKSPCIIRDGYIPALKDGGKINCVVYDGYFNDVGTLKEYILAYFAYLEKQINFGLFPSSLIERERGVYIFDFARISGGVTFTPPVAVGSGAILEDGVSAGPFAVIESGAVVKRGASVKNSFISPNSVVGESELVEKRIVHNTR